MATRETKDTSTNWRMPAEWEPHAATWLAWPHERTDWPGKLAAVTWAYAEMVRKIAEGERIRMIVQDAKEKARVAGILKRVGVELEEIDWRLWPTDRSWMRDAGPIFVRRGGEGSGAAASQLAIAGFRFNAWAKYPNWRKDVKVAGRAAKALGLPVIEAEAEGRPVVLEGGAIDVNGRGSLLTTEECLLDPEVQTRNPGLGREGLERVLAEVLGARNVIWLAKGIAGDDTHGHVDDCCRFVGPRTILLAQEPNPADPNHRILEENRERLEDARLEDGSRPEVVRLPMPAPLHFAGMRLPASYANFYIANCATLVPTFNDPRDREALGIIDDLIPGRPALGIHAVDLVWGLGTLHCLTQQEPYC